MNVIQKLLEKYSQSRLCWTDYGATEDEMMDFGEIYLFMLERFGYGP